MWNEARGIGTVEKMKRLSSRLSALIFAVAALSISPAAAQTPSAPNSSVRQDTIGYAEGTPFDPADPANASQVGPLRCYSIPLTHITPDIFLDEIDHALVPNDGFLVLKPGQRIKNAFRIRGVDTAIANSRNNSLLVSCTAYGYVVIRHIARCLDVPPLLAGTPRPINLAPEEAEFEGETKPRFRFFVFPLVHTHPDFILNVLNQAYAPSNGVVILGPGEVMLNAFRVEGVRLLIPNRRNDSFLVYSTIDGYAALKVFLRQLDLPRPRKRKPAG